MKKIACLIVLSLSFTKSIGMPVKEAVITQPHDNKIAGTQAYWITFPGLATGEPAHLYFYKSFLYKKDFRIHIKVSADQRYRLYINGREISFGPQLSDLEHWKYDSIDITPNLKEGKNHFCAHVWNFGKYKGRAMISAGPAFFLGSGEMPDLNTGDTWLVTRDIGRFFLPVISHADARGGYIAPCTDSIMLIQSPDLDLQAEPGPGKAVPAAILYTQEDPASPWKLEKRNIPYLESQPGREFEIERISGPAKQGSDDPLNITIPANSRVIVLLDHRVLTTGFPRFRFSGGHSATVKIAYAESLYLPGQKDEAGRWIQEGQHKGHRGSTAGKVFAGYRDVIIPDGKEFTFVPSWFRVYRYIQIEARTRDEPLIIEDIQNNLTAYPFNRNGRFESPDPLINEIWDIAWRTARLNAWETYMDCPYYEQLQYIGDTRIQALVSLVVDGDDRLMRNALLQFWHSIDSTGLTKAAYPSNGSSVIPTWSLYWIGMIHDFFMYRKDDDFIRQFLPAVRGILEWHEQYLSPETGMLGPMPYWNFVDWPPEWPWDPELHSGGMPEGYRNGNISVFTLRYAYVLKMAAELFEYFEMEKKAIKYRKMQSALNKATRVLCFDNKKGIFADSPEGLSYSQHANIMAVLSGAVKADEAGDFIEKIALDDELIQATIYYHFYLHEALKVAGREDLYLELLQPWEHMLELGLTTFAEKPEPTRSDCHGWGASPMYELLTQVAGIRSTAPGFGSAVIQPCPGRLSHFEAAMVHPGGNIRLSYKQKDRQDVFLIRLPEDLDASFLWKGQTRQLTAGKNELIFK